MIPPATLLGLLNRLAPTDAEAVADLHSPQIEVLPLHGGVFLGGDLDVEQAAALVPPPGDPLHESGSVHAWLRRPEPDAERLPPFGPPQPDWPMMQKLKAVLDPDDLLNRDRFLPAAQPTA